MGTDAPRTMPLKPQLLTASVVASRRRSRSFQTVTVSGPELARFEYAGLDHWFRLFLPPRPGVPLVLPQVVGRTWWQPYLAIPEDDRPHCSNYTVADFRPSPDGVLAPELDLDVVLHHDGAGRLCGAVAVWAAAARPGDRMALLDQGPLFDPPADAGELVLVGDETGLPGLRGIVRDLPAEAVGRVVVEVPHADDVAFWPAPAGVSVTWVPRRSASEVPGRRALEALCRGRAPRRDAYAMVVGESALAAGGRRWLVSQGLAKERILFSGFWRHAPAALRPPA